MNAHQRVLFVSLIATTWIVAGCGKKDPTPAPIPAAPATAAAPAATAAATPTADEPAADEPAVADEVGGEEAAGEEAVADDDEVVVVDDGDEAAEPAAADEAAPAPAPIAEANALLAPGPRAKALCAKQQECGCTGDGCEAELAEFERAVPDGAWTCIIDQGCDTLCTGEGTKGCLAAEADAFTANLRASRIDRYCARHVQCGCALEGCRENLARAEQAQVIEYAACATRLDCPAVCEEGTKQIAAGMVAYDQCLAPLLAQMNSTHKLNMGIIRSIGNTNSRRVYDADGNYLYNE